VTTLELSRNARRSPRSNALLLGAMLLVILAVLLTTAVLRKPSAPLNEAQLAAFLHDDADPTGIGYAVSEIRNRVQHGERLDRWAPELIRLSSHPSEDVRHNVAEVMGLDPYRQDFHQILLEMLRSQTVLVRNTAAISLAWFGDGSGRAMIAGMLEPVIVDAPRPGHVETITSAGKTVTHGSVLVKLQSGNTVFDVLAPVSGRIRSMSVGDGDLVSGGTRIAVIEPGPEDLIAALKALERVGKPQDVTVIANLAANPNMPEAVRQQAQVTQRKILERLQ
jgi:HEAT repeat protein